MFDIFLFFRALRHVRSTAKAHSERLRVPAAAVTGWIPQQHCWVGRSVYLRQLPPGGPYKSNVLVLPGWKQPRNMVCEEVLSGR
jgi:hypothetical protein